MGDHRGEHLIEQSDGDQREDEVGDQQGERGSTRGTRLSRATSGVGGEAVGAHRINLYLQGGWVPCPA